MRNGFGSKMGNAISKTEMGRYDYDVVGEFKFFRPDPDGIAGYFKDFAIEDRTKLA